jgi:hypothetical protein
MVRLNSVWTGTAGSPYFTQSYFQGAADAAHASQCVSAFWGLVGGLAPYVTGSLSCAISGDVEVIDISTGQITGVVSVTGAVNAGSAAGDALPFLVQGLARLQTSLYLGGRQLRGRMFLPGMMEAQNTAAGVPAAAMQTAVNTALATYIAHAADPAVYSRKYSAVASVSSATLSPKWSYLRTRRD